MNWETTDKIIVYDNGKWIMTRKDTQGAFCKPIRPLYVTVMRRASVNKLFELGVRKPLGVWYAGGIDFRRFRAPSLPIFGVILGLLESMKMYKLF